MSKKSDFAPGNVSPWRHGLIDIVQTSTKFKSLNKSYTCSQQYRVRRYVYIQMINSQQSLSNLMITGSQLAYIVHRTPATDYTPTDIFDARILKRPPDSKLSFTLHPLQQRPRLWWNWLVLISLYSHPFPPHLMPKYRWYGLIASRTYATVRQRTLAAWTDRRNSLFSPAKCRQLSFVSDWSGQRTWWSRWSKLIAVFKSCLIGLCIVIEGRVAETYTPAVTGRDGTDGITIIRNGAVDAAWGLVWGHDFFSLLFSSVSVYVLGFLICVAWGDCL